MLIRRGFTLIEVSVSLCVMLILLGVAVIISINFIMNRELAVVSETTVSYLRAAEQRALASEGNTSHGVSAVGGNLTLFRGASFADKIAGYDTIMPYPSYIIFTGITEVVFAKQTGSPSTTGTITIGNGIRTATITVNSTGSVSQ